MAAMRRLGIVDIGSNTIRLAVFVRQASGGFRLQDDVRERVRLGAGLSNSGRIEPARLRRALELLARFADYSRGARLDDLEVFGTSAIRDAANGETLLSGARELGLTIRVLSGEDEAELGVVAVSNGFDLDDAWVMDLGGGSAQISRMVGRLATGGRSFPLGAVRLTEQFLHHDPPTATEIKALEDHVHQQIGSMVEAMRSHPGPLIAIGGGVRNLARAVQIADGYPLDLLHGYWLRAASLSSLTDELLRIGSAERARIRGIRVDRSDVIHAAALVFRWVVRASGRKGLLISGGGVREGALFRHVLRHPHLVPSVRDHAIEGLIEQHIADHTRARQVRRLAAKVFDSLLPILGLGPRERILLDAAAALHEAGLSVHYYRRQKHGAFLLGASALDGFTHREQVLIILMVRNHRRGRPRLDPWQALMRAGDDDKLAGMLVCLRLSIALDRSRGSRVQELEIEISASQAVLRFAVDDSASIELQAVCALADDVGVVLGRRFAVEGELRPQVTPDPATRPVYERIDDEPSLPSAESSAAPAKAG